MHTYINRRTAFQILTALAPASLLAQPAVREDPSRWPTRPVKLVVPAAAGQAADLLARQVGQHMAKVFGQPFIVDNRAGAGGVVATAAASKAAPDGYTLVIASSGPFVMTPAVSVRPLFDPVKDFALIANIAFTPQVLLVSGSSPYKRAADLIADAKRNLLAFGTLTVGSTSHLAMELLARAADVKFNHVPFKSNQEAATQVVGGDVAALFDAAPGSLGLVKTGRLRAIGVASPQRSPFFSEVPTFAEQSLASVIAVGWIGLAAPAGTSAVILDRLNEQVRRMLDSAEALRTLESLAFASGNSSRDAFAAMLRSELARWTALAREAGIRLD